jgi:prepilin-type N-terminal cleavage/methylation domain-containing protein
MNPKVRCGFTIVEIIVVMAIIGILVAVLVPALTGARMRAKKLDELNLISNVGKSWTMYIVDHQDKLLQGYISTEVQAQLELAWAFPDESLVPPAPLYTSAMPNDAGPWTFRLLDYLDYDWRSVLFYRDTDEWTSSELREYAEIVANEPAFGYNGYYVGGWWIMNNHTSRPTTLFQSVVLTDGERTSVVSTAGSHIRKPDQQLIFCSTFFAHQGMHYHLEDDTPGSFFASPSVLARVKKWIPLPGNQIEARFDAYAPLGRFTGMPTICFADGSVESVEIETLRNQQMWIPKARQIGDTPASEFSHTVN